MYDIITRAKSLACAFDLPAFIVEDRKVTPVRSGNLDRRLLSAIHYLFATNLVTDTPRNPPFYTHLIQYDDKSGFSTLSVSAVTKEMITNVVFGPVICTDADRTPIAQLLVSLKDLDLDMEEATRMVAGIPRRDSDFLASWGDIALTYLDIPRTMHTRVHRISSDGNYFSYDGIIASEETRMMESDIYAVYAFENEVSKLVARGDKDKLKRLVIEQGGFSLKGKGSERTPFGINELRKRLLEMNTRFRISAEEAGLSPLQSHMVYGSVMVRIDKLQNTSECNQILMGMIDMYCNAVNSMNLGNNSANVLHVKRYIANNLDDKLSVEAIAEEVGLDVSYLCRLFKKESHMTVGQYIQMSRINEAKWLLESTDKPILEIAMAVGLPDQSYFAQVFAKHLGMTPTQYRKKRGM